jgi:hypothetical protein
LAKWPIVFTTTSASIDASNHFFFLVLSLKIKKDIYFCKKKKNKRKHKNNTNNTNNTRKKTDQRPSCQLTMQKNAAPTAHPHTTITTADKRIAIKIFDNMHSSKRAELETRYIEPARPHAASIIASACGLDRGKAMSTPPGTRVEVFTITFCVCKLDSTCILWCRPANGGRGGKKVVLTFFRRAWDYAALRFISSLKERQQVSIDYIPATGAIFSIQPHRCSDEEPARIFRGVTSAKKRM